MVDHPSGGSDDLSNAVAGALVMAERLSHVTPISVVAVGPSGSVMVTVGPDGNAVYDRSDDFDHTADWRPKDTPWDNSASLGRW